MKIKKLKKILLFVLVTIELASLTAAPALAVHIPSASEMAADLENRYHINMGAVQDMGESLNTSSNKSQAPQVSLSFNPSDPRPGEKISATASPMFFNNDPKNLYFTWYLQHPDCEESDSITTANQKCDLNSDGEIDVKDWKIEAARIIASNDFDWNRALGSSSANCSVYSANKPEYCSLFSKYISPDSDQDGYTANPGGNDRPTLEDLDDKDLKPHCYVRDFLTGIDYELVEKVAEQGPACEDFGDGITRTPICVRTQEDISEDLTEVNPVCKKTADEPVCSIDNLETASFSCPAPDEIPMCVDTDNNLTSDNIVFECIDYADPDPNPIPCSDPTKTADGAACVADLDCQSHSCGTDTPGICDVTLTASGACEDIDTDDDLWPKGENNPFDLISCGSEATTLNEDVDFICDEKNTQHLFAYPASGDPKDSGDGDFNAEEELFWRTNPESASTAGNGNKDEANVIGLGQVTFSWNYETGDKVGVAVEGVSAIPTKYDDSSLMIMWALPKNKCEIEKTGTYTTSIKGYDVQIPITSITDDDDGQDSCIDNNCLNDCLADNLIDPRGDQSSLNVSLSYSPDDPVNDPTSENSGDEVSVTSSVQNAKSNNYLKYQWEVYAGNSINPADGWGDPLLKSQIPGAAQTSGIGLSTFRFKLNFPNPAAYLKVKVIVMEKTGLSSSNSGTASVIIPISSTSSKIRVFSTDANDSQYLQLLANRERCATGLDNAICPIVKNEIVGMRADAAGETLSNILWTLDGQPLNPIGQNCYSGDCESNSGEATDVAYFPVLKDNGEQYSVGMTANTSSGKKINLTKAFKIVDPSVSIESTDKSSCRPVLLGNYIDLDGQQWPDYSNTDFAAATGQTISLKPVLNMPFIKSPQWFIDGSEATSLGAKVNEGDNVLSFTANKQPGESYSIVFGGVYAQSNNIKKILNSNYGIQLDAFYEKPIGSAIEVTMSDSLNDTGDAQASFGRKILASLATNVPAYMNFLFRIILTLLLILFSAKIIFSLSPKTNEK